jgi:hypothetical protein
MKFAFAPRKVVGRFVHVSKLLATVNNGGALQTIVSPARGTPFYAGRNERKRRAKGNKRLRTLMLSDRRLRQRMAKGSEEIRAAA